MYVVIFPKSLDIIVNILIHLNMKFLSLSCTQHMSALCFTHQFLRYMLRNVVIRSIKPSHMSLHGVRLLSLDRAPLPWCVRCESSKR